MALNYDEILNEDKSETVGQFDPNEFTLDKANKYINENYAKYVMSPVTPALEALASTKFDPKMAAYRTTSAPGVQPQSILSAVQGGIAGAQEGLEGTDKPVAESTADVKAVHEAGARLQSTFKSDPKVSDAEKVIKDAEQFLMNMKYYVPDKDGNIQAEAVTDKATKIKFFQLMEQMQRMSNTDGEGGGIGVQNAPALAQSIIDKLYSLEDKPEAEAIKYMKEVTEDIYKNALKTYNMQHAQAVDRGIYEGIPADAISHYVGGEQVPVQMYDISGLKEEHITKAITKESKIKSQHKQAGTVYVDLGKQDTTEQDKANDKEILALESIIASGKDLKGAPLSKDALEQAKKNLEVKKSKKKVK